MNTTGEGLRDIGQERALQAAYDTWVYQFKMELLRRARTGQPFTSEDITDTVGLPSNGENNNNAVGALMSLARRRGLIRKTGRMLPSRRPRSHARYLMEWEGA